MLDRRSFLKHAGSFASAALILPPAQKPRYKIGLQLFTVNRDMNRDPIATLERVAAIGYEEVETYGLNPAALTYYRLPAASSRNGSRIATCRRRADTTTCSSSSTRAPTT